MGTILWIDQNTFASNLIEKVFKRKGISFYTLNAPKDFAYIVEDIRPTVIVLDSETAILNLEDLKREFERSVIMQKTPFIVIQDNPELAFLNAIGELQKPLEPFSMPEALQNILGKLS